jgi:transposase
MKAYSIDLRQKIIDVYEKEKISQRQLAKRLRERPQLYCQVTQAISGDRRNSAETF